MNPEPDDVPPGRAVWPLRYAAPKRRRRRMSRHEVVLAVVLRGMLAALAGGCVVDWMRFAAER